MEHFATNRNIQNQSSRKKQLCKRSRRFSLANIKVIDIEKAQRKEDGWSKRNAFTHQ